ncbi:regulator of sigma E protease [Roseiarcus fermentans]|uniref:Regulator of sigma E protease n=1 Tax=Roseiarcus fermentans TaxID=1473586 RepID=A0A366F4Y7_9HYPH|nr:M50 family metallopeptidase [Roseiarcus fermentans]RBP09712.1 regulator of sigma E protease [Roseiarcus fermentans]
MAILHPVSELLSWLGWYVLPFIVIISAIVFIHELGHYLVGRWCGVRIDAFSIGFGPELFARVDSHGTRWRVGALPLGGYVKFHGDANAASVDVGTLDIGVEPSRTLAAQPVQNRAAIVLAGPVANFLLAFVIFTGVFMSFGRVEHMPRVGRVEANSPAAAAGFLPGDLVKSVDGDPVRSFEALQEATLLSAGLPLTFQVERDGRTVGLTATPAVTVVDQGVFGKRKMSHLGLGSSTAPSDTRIARCSVPVCAAWGADRVWVITKSTALYIVGVVAGRESTDQMSGLIGAAQMAGEIAKISVFDLFYYAALISVSVGFMNLLPIPLLDGGHLVFYAFEALLGRPLSQRMQEIGLRVGIVLVATLLVFTTSHDILRLVSSGN